MSCDRHEDCLLRRAAEAPRPDADGLTNPRVRAVLFEESSEEPSDRPRSRPGYITFGEVLAWAREDAPAPSTLCWVLAPAAGALGTLFVLSRDPLAVPLGVALCVGMGPLLAFYALWKGWS